MADSKLFTTITIENLQQTLGPIRRAGGEFLIITAESGYCPACHSDLSSANITAPNSLLGHLRRSKKCIHKREERNIKLFGLKQPDSLLWASLDDIVALDPKQFPDREAFVQAVFPPTRPPMAAPYIASVSQWQARSSGSSDGYVSSSPSPSSSSSDDGSGWNSSSSPGNSPTAGNFGPPYIAGSGADYHLSMAQYATRRESAATISPNNYYKQQAFEPQYVVGQQYAKQTPSYAPGYARSTVPGPYTAQLYQNSYQQQPSSYQQAPAGYPQGW